MIRQETEIGATFLSNCALIWAWTKAVSTSYWEGLLLQFYSFALSFSPYCLAGRFAGWVVVVGRELKAW
jgi:hypothetical protein